MKNWKVWMSLRLRLPITKSSNQRHSTTLHGANWTSTPLTKLLLKTTRTTWGNVRSIHFTSETKASSFPRQITHKMRTLVKSRNASLRYTKTTCSISSMPRRLTSRQTSESLSLWEAAILISTESPYPNSPASRLRKISKPPRLLVRI